MRLAVDFDDSLYLCAWPGVGPMVPDAREYLLRLKQDGHQLVIWSSRASRGEDRPGEREQGLQAMKGALDQDGLPYDEIDYGDRGKIRADLYVDDHGLGVPLREWRGRLVLDWPRAYQMIRLVAVSRRLGAHA